MTTLTFKVMDHTGDTRTDFDTTNSQALADAKAMFDELVGTNKNIAAKKLADGKSELLRAFEPNAGEIVFHRPLMGG